MLERIDSDKELSSNDKNILTIKILDLTGKHVLNLVNNLAVSIYVDNNCHACFVKRGHVKITIVYTCYTRMNIVISATL